MGKLGAGPRVGPGVAGVKVGVFSFGYTYTLSAFYYTRSCLFNMGPKKK